MQHNTTTNRTDFLIKTIRALAHQMTPKPTGIQPKIKHLAGIKAVLFDIYGTLLISDAGDIGGDTELNNVTEFMAAAQAVRLDMADTKTATLFMTLWRKNIHALRFRLRRDGITHPEIDIEQAWHRALASWRHTHTSSQRLGQACIRRLAIEYECRVNPVWPMPGLRKVLPSLKKDGMLLGIVSNAQFFTPLTLSAFPETGWARGFFDKNLCAWSYRWEEAKPSPRMLQAILARLSKSYGVMPNETLVVGNDMYNDILPANRLGCQTALFAGDARSLRLRKKNPACRAIIPNIILTRIEQLPDAVSETTQKTRLHKQRNPCARHVSGKAGIFRRIR